MKKRWIWLGVTIVAVVVALLAAGAATLSSLESRYQNSASAKRINDVHKIADLLESYRARTGRLPLDSDIPPGGALTVIVGAPDVERQLQPRGNPFGPEPPTLASDKLLAALQSVLGPAVRLPVDPQRSGNGAPNAYYVRFRADGQYLVAGFLRQPHDAAVEIYPGVFGYALRSKEGEWGPIWDKARTVSQVSQREREAIRIRGIAEDKRFARWVENARN